MAQSLDIFAAAVRLYRTHARTLLATSAIFLVPLGAVMAFSDLATGAFVAAGGPSWAATSGRVMLVIFSVLVAHLTGGALTVAVDAALRGEHLDWRSAWRAALGRAWPLVGAWLAMCPRVLLWTLALLFPMGLVLVLAVAWLGDPVVPWVMLLGMLPPFAVIAVRYGLVGTTAVLEDVAGGAAVDRAVDLLRGRWTQAAMTLGVVALVPLVIGYTLGVLARGGADPAAMSPAAAAVTTVAGVALQVVCQPIAAAVAVVLFRRATADRPAGTPPDPTSG